MTHVWVTSDWHLGHKSITKYRPQFSSAEEHHLTILENVKSVVKKRDLLIVLGDSIFTDEWIEPVAAIPCQKHVYLGNHCMQHGDISNISKAFDKVYGIRAKYGAWLSHAPIHPDELRGKFNFHGHTHNHIIDDWRYINVCPEHWDFRPINIDVLKGIMEERRKCGDLL